MSIIIAFFPAYIGLRAIIDLLTPVQVQKIAWAIDYVLGLALLYAPLALLYYVIFVAVSRLCTSSDVVTHYQKANGEMLKKQATPQHDSRSYTQVFEDWFASPRAKIANNCEVTANDVHYFFEVTDSRIVAVVYHAFNNAVLLASSIHTVEVGESVSNDHVQTVKKQQLGYALDRLFSWQDSDRVMVSADPVTYQAILDMKPLRNLDVASIRAMTRIDRRRLHSALRDVLYLRKEGRIAIEGQVTTQPIWNRNVDRAARKSFLAAKAQVKRLTSSVTCAPVSIPAFEEVIKTIKASHPSPYVQVGEGPLIKDFIIKVYCHNSVRKSKTSSAPAKDFVKA